MIGGESVEVVRLGRGDPIVVMPGLGGRLEVALAAGPKPGRHFEVITFGLARRSMARGTSSIAEPGRIRAIGDYAQDVVVLDRSIGSGGAGRFWRVIRGGDRPGAGRRVSRSAGGFDRARSGGAGSAPTIGSRIARRVLERFPLPNDSRFINQFFHLLFGAKPEPGPLVDFVIDRIWETGQRVMAERLAQLEVVRYFGSALEHRRADAGAGGRARRDRAGGPAACPGRRDFRRRFGIIEDAGHIGFLTHRLEVVRRVRRHMRRARTAV